MNNNLVKNFVIGTFVSLYLLVSIVSTIHVINFFELSNPYWLAVTLAIGFEVGAAASLASLVILDKMNKTLVWALFITITLMQMQGNMYHAFTNLENFQSWSELFNLIEEEPLYQKRILSLVSGAILPLVALGFIKSLVDYIKPQDDSEFTPEDSSFSSIGAKDTSEPDPIPEKEWDEDHELDRVMNDMSDFDEFGEDDFPEYELEDVLDPPNAALVNAAESYKEELVESNKDDFHDLDVTLNDGLADIDVIDPVIIEPWSDITKSEEPDSYENNPTSVGAVVKDITDNQEEGDLMEIAKRKLAMEQLQRFVKEKRNGKDSADKA